jgi:ADP-heptose:LPS heptosyltransferase
MNRLEDWWRHKIVYPTLRLLLNNPPAELPLDIHKVQRVLIYRYDRIGDMIVTTPIFRLLKEMHPGVRVGVLASETNVELIKYNPYVDDIYVLYKNYFKRIRELLRIRACDYQVVFHLVFNRTTRGALLAKFIAPHAILIGQGDIKYRFYFNVLLQQKRFQERMVFTFAGMVKKTFGIADSVVPHEYEIILDESSKQRVYDFTARHSLALRGHNESADLPYIVFNLSATEAVCRISLTQSVALVQHLMNDQRFTLVLSTSPTDIEMRTLCKQLTATGRCVLFPDQGSASLLELAALIQHSIAVITPDTSVVHFASAMKAPVLGFFTPRQGKNEWLPYQVPYQLVTAEEGKDVSTIPISTMINAVDTFMNDCLGSRR